MRRAGSRRSGTSPRQLWKTGVVPEGRRRDLVRSWLSKMGIMVFSTLVHMGCIAVGMQQPCMHARRSKCNGSSYCGIIRDWGEQDVVAGRVWRLARAANLKARPFRPGQENKVAMPPTTALLCSTGKGGPYTVANVGQWLAGPSW